MKARKKCEICSELTMKTLERRRSGVFIINFEHIIQLLLSLLLTLNNEILAARKTPNSFPVG